MEILEKDEEVLFENMTMVTKKLYYEYREKIFDKESKVYRLIVIIAAIYFFVKFAISLLDGDIILAGMNWFASAITIFMHFKGYILYARKELKILKRKSEKAEDKGEIIYKFYKDHLVLTSYNSQITSEYNSITKMYSTKNIFIVKTGILFFFLLQL